MQFITYHKISNELFEVPLFWLCCYKRVHVFFSSLTPVVPGPQLRFRCNSSQLVLHGQAQTARLACKIKFSLHSFEIICQRLSQEQQAVICYSSLSAGLLILWSYLNTFYCEVKNYSVFSFLIKLNG